MPSGATVERMVLLIKNIFGSGSAPSLTLRADTDAAQRLPAAFQAFFPSWQQAVHFLSQHNAALAEIPASAQLAHAGIDLPLDTRSVLPGHVCPVEVGAFLAAFGVADEPLCCVTPRVRFRVLWERSI